MLPPETDDTRSIWLARGRVPSRPGTDVAASARTTPSASAAARDPADTFPTQDQALVKEMVGVAHGNVKRVKELVDRQQTLAKAKVAEAEGDAQATLVKAKAQAEANRLLQETLNPLLVQSKAIDRWNGILPQFSGGGVVPFLNITPDAPKSR